MVAAHAIEISGGEVVSPDGRWAVFRRGEDLWPAGPCWVPDGRHVYFTADQTGR